MLLKFHQEKNVFQRHGLKEENRSVTFRCGEYEKEIDFELIRREHRQFW